MYFHTLAQFFPEKLRYSRFLAQDKSIGHFKDSDPGAYGFEKVTVFDGNISSADNYNALRFLFKLQHSLVCQIIDSIQAFYRRYRYSRAGSYADLFARYLFRIDLKSIILNKMCLALVEVY